MCYGNYASSFNGIRAPQGQRKKEKSRRRDGQIGTRIFVKMPVKMSYRVWQPKRQKTPVAVELQKAWQRKARNKFEGTKLRIKRSLLITKSSYGN